MVFLSEAFTRPHVMHELARVGFTQSYTYFTWRVAKQELVDYATEVSTSPSADEFRPNFWPNTPDILPWHLQEAPREMFALRHLLAATLSASYGDLRARSSSWRSTSRPATARRSTCARRSTRSATGTSPTR